MIVRSVFHAALLTAIVGVCSTVEARSDTTSAVPDTSAPVLPGTTRPLPGRGAPPRVPTPPTPPTPRPGRETGNPHWVAWMTQTRNTDSATVMRLDVQLAATDSARTTEPRWDTRIASEARVGRDWIERFINLLRPPATYQPDSMCRPADLPGLLPDQLVAGVRFGPTAAAPALTFMLRERCAQLQLGDRVSGSVAIEPTARGLFELIREALPRDEVVARIPPPPPWTPPEPAAEPVSQAAPVAPSSQSAQAPAGPTQEAGLMGPPAPTPQQAGLAGPPAPKSGPGTKPRPAPASQASAARSDTAKTRPARDLPAFGQYVPVDAMPVAVATVDPKWPDGPAKPAAATVVVQALVGKDGLVKDTRIVRSVPQFDVPAAEAVRQWRFKPAVSKGKPVAVWTAVSVKLPSVSPAPPDSGTSGSVR